VESAGGEGGGGEHRQQGEEENEREIPGQVYHRLAKREQAGFGAAQLVGDENYEQGRERRPFSGNSYFPTISSPGHGVLLARFEPATRRWCLYVKSPRVSPCQFG
jgi:hypothetical protein